MITIVFILGFLNLVLGYLLVATAEPSAARLTAWLAVGNSAALPAEPQLPLNVEPPAEPSSDPTCQPLDTPAFELQALPRDWQRLLDENRINPCSRMESLLWMIKFRLSLLRADLVDLEVQLAASDNGAESAATAKLAMLLTRWQSNQQGWCERLSAFTKVLAELQHEDLATLLQDILLDHQFDAQQTVTSLKLMLEPSQPGGRVGSSNSATLRRELCEQLDAIHLIRDRVDELLATYLRENGRLLELDEQLQLDNATEIYNRLGFEVIFQEWRDANPQGEQPLCCLLVDIDRFSQKNERIGNQTGDIVIAAFGGLLKSLVRIERGFDRVARFDGHSYVLFLGETVCDEGTTVAERTRQCIEATSFMVGGESFDVTSSLGLAEFDPEVDVNTFYKSLREAVVAAKNAGRNRTSVMRGNHPEIASIGPIQVTGRVIEIGGHG